MKRMIGFLLGVLLLGGCAVYTEPLPPAAGIYVAPPPAAVVVEPRAWGAGAVDGITGGADGARMKNPGALGHAGVLFRGTATRRQSTTILCAPAFASLTCTL